MNVDVENITNKEQKSWRQIYKVIETSNFAATKLFPTEFLDQFINNPDNPQNLPSEVKVALKNGYVTGVIWTSGCDPLKGVRE